MKRVGDVRRAGLLAALCLAGNPAGAWEIRVPVVAAEPVYDAAGGVACSVPPAGPVQAAELAEAIARDLDFAACVPSARPVLGWDVRYRFDGREYRTFMTDHPGTSVAVKVRVQSVSSSPTTQTLPPARVRIRR
jgi:hypothetical protein